MEEMHIQPLLWVVGNMHEQILGLCAPGAAIQIQVVSMIACVGVRVHERIAQGIKVDHHRAVPIFTSAIPVVENHISDF
jgi:hypothetical protein